MFLRISQNRWFSSQVRLEGKADFSPSLAHNTLKVVKSTTDLSVTASIIKTTEELNLACCTSTKWDFSLQNLEIEAEELLPCQHKYFCITEQRSFWVRMLHKEHLGQHHSFPGSLSVIQMQSQSWKSRRWLGQYVILTLIPKKASAFKNWRESIIFAKMLHNSSTRGAGGLCSDRDQSEKKRHFIVTVSTNATARQDKDETIFGFSDPQNVCTHCRKQSNRERTACSLLEVLHILTATTALTALAPALQNSCPSCLNHRHCH